VHCTKRYPGCQDHCEHFKEAKEANDKRKAVEREKREQIHAANDFAVRQTAKGSGKKRPQR
jgi:hypothetical protein